MLADISSRRSSIQSMQGLVLLIFIVSIFIHVYFLVKPLEKILSSGFILFEIS